MSQRAAEVRQVVEAMPAKAAELRAAVVATAGHVKQLRTDLAGVLPPLLASGDADTPARLREIESAADVLAEAGYRLAGIEHEPGVGGRTRVLLERVDSVALPRLQALAAMHSEPPPTQALLAAIVQATELAAKVEFEHLVFSEILVELGVGQTVRIGWRAEDPVVRAPAVAAEVRPPMFSQSSFFARPTAAAETPAPVAAAAMGGGEVSPPGTPPVVATPGPDWRATALDRFKKMPDLTKRTAR